jgi:hypothetical protein
MTLLRGMVLLPSQPCPCCVMAESVPEQSDLLLSESLYEAVFNAGLLKPSSGSLVL